MTGDVILDTRSAERGSIAEWVQAFRHAWTAPAVHLDRLMALLSADVHLRAPTYPRSTIGQSDGRRAFERVLIAMPDLHGDVLSWSAAEDLLFIEMRFEATLAGAPTRWYNVDRIRFANQVAVERVAYFDPTKVRRILLARPSGWVQIVRLRWG